MIDPVTDITWKARRFGLCDDEIDLTHFDLIEIRRGHHRMTIKIEDERLCVSVDSQLTVLPVDRCRIDILIK